MGKRADSRPGRALMRTALAIMVAAMAGAAGTLAAVLTAVPGANAESAASGTGRVLDLATVAPPDHTMTGAALTMAETLEATTHGALRIRVHHSSRRGNETSMLAQLGSGDLDAAILTMGELARHDDKLNAFFTPYLAGSQAEASRIAASGAALSLVRRVEASLGVRVAGLAVLGPRHMVLTTKTAESGAAPFPPGARVRVPPSPAIADFYAALGAAPQPLPLPGVRGELAGDALDGADMDLEVMALAGYEGPAPYAILSGHMIFPVAALVSEHTWASLPEDLRHVLARTLRDELAAISRSYEDREVVWREELARRGMTFLPVPHVRLEQAAAQWRAAHPELIPLAEALREEARDAP